MASRQIASTDLADLRLASQSKDPNVRIVAAWLMGALENTEAIEDLVGLLLDRSFNVQSGVLQCEDEEVVTVGGAAAEALVRLGYAPDVESVFARAKREVHLPPDSPVLRNSY